MPVVADGRVDAVPRYMLELSPQKHAFYTLSWLVQPSPVANAATGSATQSPALEVHSAWRPDEWHHVVVSWSRAENARHIYLDGKLELKGGSREDRSAAKEWISMFMHEAVVKESP